ncbi:hypothetical protein O9993_19125 [Vibrio lentus]|nr:hypothetical protein [Vibrio lentus]
MLRANSHQTKWRNAAVTWRVSDPDSSDLTFLFNYYVLKIKNPVEA